MRRFYERSLLYDPHEVGDGQARRVDIGTSFGHHRSDREKFHAHSAETLALFETLFDGYDDPVRTMYDALAQLAPGKEVKTAREPDGRLYGPAIFRVYHRETGHGPALRTPWPSALGLSSTRFRVSSTSLLGCFAFRIAPRKAARVSRTCTHCPLSPRADRASGARGICCLRRPRRHRARPSPARTRRPLLFL